MADLADVARNMRDRAKRLRSHAEYFPFEDTAEKLRQMAAEMDNQALALEVETAREVTGEPGRT
jgi:hypothetical protein